MYILPEPAAAGIAFPAGPLAVVQAELAPEHLRTLALGSQPASPEYLLERGIVDRLVASERLRQIVEQDDEPLHREWTGS